jgi:hypothetical protein
MEKILTDKEVQYVVAQIHDKVKVYSNISDQVLKTVISHMLVDSLDDILKNREDSKS